MGQVFQAVDRDGRQLAVKLLREDISSQPGLIARFINESEVLRGIDHPNVVKVHDSLVMSASNRPAAMMRSSVGLAAGTAVRPGPVSPRVLTAIVTVTVEPSTSTSTSRL